jgi:diguanylate cyclase (GGDEF)-like protein/PAS domain S-box-containing protein
VHQNAARRLETAGAEAALLQARLGILFAQIPSATTTSALVALLTIALLWDVASPAALATWGASIYLVSSGRLLLAHRYRAARDRNERLWLHAYLVGTALAGGSWGGLAVLLDPAWPTMEQIGVLTMLAGVCAGAISNNGTHLGAYLAFLVPCLTPIVLRLAASGDPTLTLIGVAAVLYGAGLGSVARPYSQAFAQAQILAREKGQLVDQLSAVNDDLSAEVLQRRAAEVELARERRLFIEGPVTVFRWQNDDAWTVCHVSPNVRYLGLDRERLVRDRASYKSLIHPDDVERVAASEFRRSSQSSLPYVDQDYRLVLPGGETRWVYDYTVPVKDVGGRITHLDGYILDITDRKQAEAALLHEKALAEVTLGSIGDGIVRTDADGRVEYLNPVAERLTGWSAADAHGHALDEVCPIVAEDGGARVDVLQAPARPGQRTDSHHVLSRPDGGRFSVSWTVAPLHSADGAIRGTVLALHDVTEACSLARRLIHQASHDPLTGLMNRREFEHSLAKAIETARLEGLQHVCLYMDLDQFKVVNDTCGHAAGDELLRQLGTLLQSRLRGSDALARLGGDEFGVLLTGCPLTQGQRLAEELRSAIRAFRFVWADKTFEMGVSIGAVWVSGASGSVSAVLSAADVACYAAKDLGRNRIHVYQESDLDLARRRGEMQYVHRITKALAEDRLVLYSQDIVPVTPVPGAPQTMEMLVRMRDDDGKLVPPNTFLPAAERYNLMPSIDRWVARTSFAWLAARPDPGGFRLSINLSGTTLSDDAFLDFVGELFAAHPVPPAAICFEITETAAIANLAAASRFIRELRQLGCLFALDDFGSGLSSFGYLKNLPVDFLKIDGSFVRDLLTNPIDRAMVRAINEVGHAMGIRTIAEFVERHETLHVLAALGVDYAQGWAVGRPRPLAERGLDQESVRAAS